MKEENGCKRKETTKAEKMGDGRVTKYTGLTRCEKCGKLFAYKYAGQKHCYDPCLPKNLNRALMVESRIRTDCMMHKYLEDGTHFCTGLNDVYCGYENCKFYKARE